jgi:hypothetical protein
VRERRILGPWVFSLALAQVGTMLEATVELNGFVAYWEVWDKVGASPLVGGVPDDTYGKGEYQPGDLSASWSVQDGTHHVVVRAFSGPDGVEYHELADTIVISGVGSGPLDPPTEIPGTPVLTLGALVGSDQELNLSWFNTNDVSALRVVIFSGGVSVVTADLVVGTDSYSTSVPATGGRAKAHAQYSNGPGLDGPWSAFSPDVRLGGP